MMTITLALAFALLLLAGGVLLLGRHVDRLAVDVQRQGRMLETLQLAIENERALASEAYATRSAPGTAIYPGEVSLSHTRHRS